MRKDKLLSEFSSLSYGMPTPYKPRPKVVLNKRWFIQKHNKLENKWQKYSKLCLTMEEANYILDLLERQDKFDGTLNTYRRICINA